MPTAKKEAQVEEIKDKLSRCTIAIATGYQGLSGSDMTDLRRRLREQGIEYRVVKNTLTLLAAQQLGKEGIGDVMQGPTGLAFGYGDEAAVAKGLNTYITSTRSPLVINGAVMGRGVISGDQVRNLATLPPREELLARLLGQMQAPVTGLVYLLSAPLRGLVTVLQRAAESGSGSQGGTAVMDEPAEQAETPPPDDPVEVAEDSAPAEVQAEVDEESAPTAEAEVVADEEESPPTEEEEAEAEAAP